MNESDPFIQSVYCRRDRTSVSGSDCTEKLALGVQYAWHTSQPSPASQAPKNCLATTVMLDMALPPGSLCMTRDDAHLGMTRSSRKGCFQAASLVAKT